MQLPLWLLNFEEAIEVLVGDPERKQEIEILQELIPMAKSRYAAGRAAGEPETAPRRRRSWPVHGRHTRSLSHLGPYRSHRRAHGKLENKRDLAPYRNLKSRIDTISQDGRYAFMFGSLTVYDGMTQILSRIFRVPVQGKPITILELTGIPTEIVNVVVSVLCRMTFDFALWSEGKVPVTLVCEEAHRYVPLNANAGFEPCKRAIAKIAKEGRKYGASLCIVTQRPAESIQRSCPSATPCSRFACPTIATRRSCSLRFRILGRGFWNSFPLSASAKLSRSAMAWRCPFASNSTSCRVIGYPGLRRPSSPRSGRVPSATKTSSIT